MEPEVVMLPDPTTRQPSVHPRAIAAAIACSSASALTFEIALTRVFAITQFYHFAFMTVSLALLGFGASGSVLTAFPCLGRGGPPRWAVLAVGQAAGTLGGYTLANALPFDSFSIAWDARQLVYLIISYVALVVPFFFGGAVTGAILSSGQSRIASHRVYAANLIGSGAGCLFALGGLAWFGGPGVICLAAISAMAAALLFELAADHRSVLLNALTAAAIILFAIGIIHPPDLQISPYKDLSAVLRYPGSQIISTRWNAASRVDRVQSGGIRSLPGLSFAFRGSPPKQDGVTFDGDDLSPIPLIDPHAAPFAPYLLTSLPFMLRPDGEALILEPRGGLDVFIALANDAQSVLAVEPNELAIEAARNVYADRRVQVLLDEPRAFAERSRDQFDVIDLALTAPYRPVMSGAYSLVEDYRFTVEAFEQYLLRLNPDGLLSVMRWLQTPPSEETRLIGIAAASVRRSGGDPRQSIVALRGYSTALVLVKRAAFTPSELASIRAFAESRRFDFIAAPDLQAEETNRYNVLPDDAYYRLAASILSAPDPASNDESYPFDITPPTDDHPFFSHFFKWAQAPEVLATLGKTWQPFGGAGYFVLIMLLGWSSMLALILIMVPLAVRRSSRSKTSTPFSEEGSKTPHAVSGAGTRVWTFAYFGLLGVGFLLVEIPLIQQYILLVGRSTIAFAVVLFALLIASGLGSLASRRMPWRASAIALAMAVALYPSVIRALTSSIPFAPVEARLIIGGLALTPLGFLMGIMFPRGIAYLEAHASEWVPWAWGINGATSVISAIAAALLALTFGFSVVIACGAACYGVCSLLVRGTKRTSPRL
jgi:hypothetical protein